MNGNGLEPNVSLLLLNDFFFFSEILEMLNDMRPRMDLIT